MNNYYTSPDEFLRGNSENYRNWQSMLNDMKTCQDCHEKHGKIYNINAFPYQPNHIYCRCVIIPMRTKIVGTASEKGWDGADAWLMYRAKLPDYYITEEEAITSGWKPSKGNFADVCPGKMLGNKIYANYEKKLPDKIGRTWREADLDYISGYRNNRRILYSSDGLIFVSYDHGQTFYELIK
jgi:uncharacterized protein with gpF-like domain